VLAVLERLAPLVLRAGLWRWSGTTPCGCRFVTSPRSVWAVIASWATLAGRLLGPWRRFPRQVALGGFWIPPRPLFTIGESRMG
jgi:hypothetical protein